MCGDGERRKMMRVPWWGRWSGGVIARRFTTSLNAEQSVLIRFELSLLSALKCLAVKLKPCGAPRFRVLDSGNEGDYVRLFWRALVILAFFLLAAVPSPSQVSASSSGGSDPGYFANWFNRVDRTPA